MNGERLDPIHAIDIQGLCPEGWHIPSVMEWKKFEEFLQTQEDQYGRIEWTRFLGEYPGVAFYLFDFHDGVQWISDGFTTYSTNVSDTFVRLESDKLGYKSTMVYPDEKRL